VHYPAVEIPTTANEVKDRMDLHLILGIRSRMGECGEIKLMKSGFLLQIEENIK
jgi:hypothetical protein